MDGQEEPAAVGLPAIEVRGAQQRRLAEIEARLQTAGEGLQLRRLREPRKQRRFVDGRSVDDLLMPRTIALEETKTERFVMIDDRGDRLSQQREIDTLAHFEHLGEIPMMRIGEVALEEPVLHRRQRELAA